jgi:hypothetical protein
MESLCIEKDKVDSSLKEGLDKSERNPMRRAGWRVDGSEPGTCSS